MSNIHTIDEQTLKNWIKQFPDEFINLNPTQQHLAIALYRLLAHGKPVSMTALAKAANQDRETVQNQLDLWSGVFYDDQKKIIGYWGLTPTNATDFSLQVDHHTLYTWCAWDALFIPALLNRDAILQTSCHLTGESIKIVITPHGIARVTPNNTVMSWIVTTTEKIAEDVVNSFCHHVWFFKDTASGERWLADQTTRHELMSLDDAFRLAQQKNAIQFKDIDLAAGIEKIS